MKKNTLTIKIKTRKWIDDIIRKNPKWLQGYSDPTGLLFTITTNLDIATIYGSNFCVFGMKNWHKSCLDNLEILKGNIISLKKIIFPS